MKRSGSFAVGMFMHEEKEKDLTNVDQSEEGSATTTTHKTVHLLNNCICCIS